MKTKSAALSEQNARRTSLRREAISKNVRSPFKQSIYITARLNGSSPETALKKAETKYGLD